ncbi:RHS repeat-associated core domain-containing protein [bacterium]|nr:RHS repeat-associated core domain-containing protein [bacterium]
MYDSPQVEREHLVRLHQREGVFSCSKARYYNPTIGRFVSEDPLPYRIAQNFYAYSINDPIIYIDPDGLAHKPGGPPHPVADGVKFACKETDTCEVLERKMGIFQELIKGHREWDARNWDPTWKFKYPHGRHAEDIQTFVNGLIKCQRMYDKKCKDRSCESCKRLVVIAGAALSAAVVAEIILEACILLLAL